MTWIAREYGRCQLRITRLRDRAGEFTGYGVNLPACTRQIKRTKQSRLQGGATK